MKQNSTIWPSAVKGFCFPDEVASINKKSCIKRHEQNPQALTSSQSNPLLSFHVGIVGPSLYQVQEIDSNYISLQMAKRCDKWYGKKMFENPWLERRDQSLIQKIMSLNCIEWVCRIFYILDPKCRRIKLFSGMS